MKRCFVWTMALLGVFCVDWDSARTHAQEITAPKTRVPSKVSVSPRVRPTVVPPATSAQPATKSPNEVAEDVGRINPPGKQLRATAQPPWKFPRTLQGQPKFTCPGCSFYRGTERSDLFLNGYGTLPKGTPVKVTPATGTSTPPWISKWNGPSLPKVDTERAPRPTFKPVPAPK